MGYRKGGPLEQLWYVIKWRVANALRRFRKGARFMDALKAEGRDQYTLGEYIDKVVHPVVKL